MLISVGYLRFRKQNEHESHRLCRWTQQNHGLLALRPPAEPVAWMGSGSIRLLNLNKQVRSGANGCRRQDERHHTRQTERRWLKQEQSVS